MNRIVKRTRNHIENQKKKYLFLLGIIIIGIISGIIFILFISKEDKLLVKNEIEMVFTTISNHKINYISTLINSLSTYLLSLIGIYLLGISIIGMPLIILFLYIKGFVFGFSISSIINIYHLKGVPVVLSYLCPSHFIALIVWLLLGFHAIGFSIKLFRYLFLKENIPLNRYFKKLNKVLLISLFLIIICSLLETFLSPFLIDLCL